MSPAPRDVGERACPSFTTPSAQCLCSIFDHRHAASVGDATDLFDIAHQAVEMGHHYRGGLVIDERFDLTWVDIAGLPLDVGENRVAATRHDHVDDVKNGVG
jgi:hypothetical protein